MGVVTAQPSPTNAPRQLSDQNGLGTVLGASATDLIGFYGVNPGVARAVSRGSLSGAGGTVTVYATTQSPTSVAANTSAEQALTVTGVATGQLVLLVKPTAQAGLIVGTARVSATNTIQITFGNDTAAVITPTATETYLTVAIPATMLYTAVLSPAPVAPNTTAEQFFTVAGAGANAAVWVNKPTAQAGLIITGAASYGGNLIGITFANLTAATITPTAAESYLVFAQQGISLASVETTLTAVLSPAAVAPNTSAEQTFTVAGLISGTPVFVNKPGAQNGLSIGGARVSAANTLAITFVNNTAATITPTASETYTIGWFPGAVPAAGSSTAYNSVAGGSDRASLVAMGLLSA
jgi:hypothetical protein